MIAVNYPARKFGIGRHCTVTDAKKLCPDLVSQHVATWREGDDKWAYRSDAAENIHSDKVSLDPYRLESRKILALIKDHLPSNLQKVEKASIDEVFLDLSAHVYSIMLERFPELANPAPYDDPTENLPMPPIVALDWQADALVDLETGDAEIDDPDWDDVAMLIGSEIVRSIRAAVWEKLHYTCSAGISTNKMLSKLGSGHKKPNQQTVIRNRARQHFLSDFKFTKIRNLGGKLGDQVVAAFKTDTVRELLAVSVEQLTQKLGADTGVWLYEIIRGIDTSEVNARTQIKSMLSAKSFRPSINTIEQAERWLRIFAADIFARLVEDGLLEKRRRPRTVNLHTRHGGQTRSRQAPIPQGRALDEDALVDLAKTLLHQTLAEGNLWPCANLSLSIGGFEDGVVGNMSIGAFLVKGEEAQALKAVARESWSSTSLSARAAVQRPVEKRRRLQNDNNTSIQRFLTKRESSAPAGDIDTEAEGEPMAESLNDHSGSRSNETASLGLDNAKSSPAHAACGTLGDSKGACVVTSLPDKSISTVFGGPGPEAEGLLRQRSESSALGASEYKCAQCNDGSSFGDPETLQNHLDWHLAVDLQRVESRFAAHRQHPDASSSTRKGHSAKHEPPASGKSNRGRHKKLEAGQSKLKFG